MTTTTETQIPGEFPPGIYRIVVASHGRFLHERLTDGPHVTITPPSAKPDPKQLWQVNRGRKHGTITIQRPGIMRPPLSLTYKSEHGLPKEGNKLELRRDEFPTEWELAIAPGHRYYIRVANFGPRAAGEEAAESAVPGRTLGIAVAPELINPPFLEIDHKDQLEWIFERVAHDHLEGEEV